MSEGSDYVGGGTVTHRPSPKREDHRCQPPGWWPRWRHNIIEGTRWRCDACGREWRLEMAYDGIGGGGPTWGLYRVRGA